MKKVLIVVLCLMITLASLLSNTTIKTTKAAEEETPQPYEANNNIFNWQQLKNIIENEHEFIITLTQEEFTYDNFISTGTVNLFYIGVINTKLRCSYKQENDNLYLNIKSIEMEASLMYDEQESYLSNTSTVNQVILIFNLENYINYETTLPILLKADFESRYNSFNIMTTVIGYDDSVSIYDNVQTPSSVNVVIGDLVNDISKEFPHEQYRQNYLSISDHVRNEIDTSQNYNNIMQNTFSSISDILNVQIFPGITIGLIIGLPLLLGLFLIILKLIRG